MPRTYLKKGVRPINMDRENLEKAFNPSGPPPTEAGFGPLLAYSYGRLCNLKSILSC